MAKVKEGGDGLGLILALLNPILVMGLVGSLAFYLLDVFYRGDFDGRLRWTMFFYVCGMVLVCRICLNMGTARGVLYGFLLGLVTYIAAARFASAAGLLINLAVIVVIAGSTYFLTRDTTRQPGAPSDRGLAANLAAAWQLLPAEGRRVTRGRRGLSVVYFSLAAIPLFALGQSLIPVEDAGRRAYAFWLMTVYIASALGLLLTSALMNLRSYLLERNLALPPSMVGLWLVAGGMVVAGAAIIGALVPRPHSETPLFTLRGQSSTGHAASQAAAKGGKAGEGEGRSGGEGEHGGQDAGGKDGRPDEKAKSRSRRGEKGAGGEKSSQHGEGGDQKGKQGGDSDRDGDSEDSANNSSQSAPNNSLTEAISSVAKWLVWIAAIVAVLFVLFRGLAGASATFRRWYDQLLALLRRRPPREAAVAESAGSDDDEIHLPRFASFHNPFTHNDGNRDAGELVRYSFAALEAWARDHQAGRAKSETPLEFARRLNDEQRPPAMRLAELYSLLSYRGRRSLPDDCRDAACAVWDFMDRPMMAVDERN